MPKIPPSIIRFIECLGKQRDCYVLLLDVVQRQRKAIEEENDEALAQAMQAKNPLLLKMQKLDEEMKPLMQSLTEAEREQMPSKAKALKDEATGTLKQILAEEEVSARILNKKKDETFDQMKALQETKKGLKSYKETSGGKPPGFSQEG